MDEDPVPRPARVKVTAAWLAEQEAKQAAYAARRRHDTSFEQPGSEASAGEAADPSPLSGRRRPRRTIADGRQLGLKF